MKASLCFKWNAFWNVEQLLTLADVANFCNFMKPKLTSESIWCNTEVIKQQWNSLELSFYSLHKHFLQFHFNWTLFKQKQKQQVKDKCEVK